MVLLSQLSIKLSPSGSIKLIGNISACQDEIHDNTIVLLPPERTRGNVTSQIGMTLHVLDVMRPYFQTHFQCALINIVHTVVEYAIHIVWEKSLVQYTQ